jgi:hypothetical protein
MEVWTWGLRIDLVGGCLLEVNANEDDDEVAREW